MGLHARACVHVEPAMNSNANAEWYCLFRVIHIHVQRFDAMFLSIPFYKIKATLFQYFDAIVSKKLCICIKEEGKFNHHKAQKNFPSSN